VTDKVACTGRVSPCQLARLLNVSAISGAAT